MSDFGANPPPPQTPRPAPRPARKPLPNPLTVITAALGLWLVVLTLLALQVRAGRDPSLSQSSGANGKASSKSSPSSVRNVVSKTS